jgi:hypothetical protein
MQIFRRPFQRQSLIVPNAAYRLRLRGDGFDPAKLVSLLPSISAKTLAFEINVRDGAVSFELVGAGAPGAANLIAGSYGGLDAARVEALRFEAPVAGWRLQTTLSDALPLVGLAKSQADLPSALANLLARYEGLTASYQVVFRAFESEGWRQQAAVAAQRLTQLQPSFLQQALGSLLHSSRRTREPRPPTWLSAYQQEAFAKAEQGALFLASVRFVAAGSPGREVRDLAMQALRLATGAFASGVNGLVPAPIKDAAQIVDEFNSRSLVGAAVLAATEAAVLWHLPRQLSDVPALRPAARIAASPNEARRGEHAASTYWAVMPATGQFTCIASTAVATASCWAVAARARARWSLTRHWPTSRPVRASASST